MSSPDLDADFQADDEAESTVGTQQGVKLWYRQARDLYYEAFLTDSAPESFDGQVKDKTALDNCHITNLELLKEPSLPTDYRVMCNCWLAHCAFDNPTLHRHYIGHALRAVRMLNDAGKTRRAYEMEMMIENHLECIRVNKVTIPFIDTSEASLPENMNNGDQSISNPFPGAGSVLHDSTEGLSRTENGEVLFSPARQAFRPSDSIKDTVMVTETEDNKDEEGLNEQHQSSFEPSRESWELPIREQRR